MAMCCCFSNDLERLDPELAGDGQDGEDKGRSRTGRRRVMEGHEDGVLKGVEPMGPAAAQCITPRLAV